MHTLTRQFFYAFRFLSDFTKSEIPLFMCVLISTRPSVEMRDANIAKCFNIAAFACICSARSLARDGMPIRINYLDLVRSTMGGRHIAARCSYDLGSAESHVPERTRTKSNRGFAFGERRRV